MSGRKPALLPNLRVPGSMAHGYRELLSAHMVVLALVSGTGFAIVSAMVVPVGFFPTERPAVRLLYAMLYLLPSLPANLGLIVLALYFLRFRKPIEILAGVAVAILIGAFLCSTVMYTIAHLARPGHPAEVGFAHVYIRVAAAALCFGTLYFSLLWQRVYHTAPAVAAAEAGREVPGAAGAASGAAEAAPGGGAHGQPSAAPEHGDRGHTAATGAAAARGRPLGDQPFARHTAPAAAVQEQERAGPRRDARSGRLLKLLPDRLGTDLVYLKSEDHYLEVHTTVGSSLIKMRFSDAVAELGDRGVQVHRSYWVATGHVLRSVRSGKRTVLRLTGSHSVPVSATHLRDVRAALARRQ